MGLWGLCRVGTRCLLGEGVAGGGVAIEGWERGGEGGAGEQVFGPESSGKTTLALHAMAEVQRAGGKVALIDAEHAFDPKYSKVCKQRFSRPRSA